jgi:hypothetical protein
MALPRDFLSDMTHCIERVKQVWNSDLLLKCTLDLFDLKVPHLQPGLCGFSNCSPARRGGLVLHRRNKYNVQASMLN